MKVSRRKVKDIPAAPSRADDFDRELAYEVLMHLARELKGKGLLSDEEFKEAELAMRKAYAPPTDGLFSAPLD